MAGARGLDVWNVRAVLVVLDSVRSRAVDWCGSQRGFLILINFYFLGSTAREWFDSGVVRRRLVAMAGVFGRLWSSWIASERLYTPVVGACGCRCAPAATCLALVLRSRAVQSARSGPSPDRPFGSGFGRRASAIGRDGRSVRAVVVVPDGDRSRAAVAVGVFWG